MDITRNGKNIFLNLESPHQGEKFEQFAINQGCKNYSTYF